ncbi:glycosyltransferase family 2 protein [Bradyrhizobium manausense]|nr:glycosyltransferase family 2 protein [Bradyrhizobium manausense]
MVVVPCLNEERHIEDLIDYLVADLGELQAQIVVVDGGSTDRTVEIVQRLSDQGRGVHLIHNPRRFQSSSLNLAVDQFGSGFDYLLRLDAHGQYPGGYCSALLSEAENLGADAVVVSMRSEGRTCFQKAAASAQNSILGNGGSAHRNEAAGRWIDHGHHALVRIASFRAIGGYDTDFSHNEDAEFDVRLRQAGFRIWLTGLTSMIYYPRLTVAGLFRQYFSYGAGRAKNALKHRQSLKVRQLLPLAVVPAVALLPFGVFLPLMMLPAAGWIASCLGVGLLLGLRERQWCAGLSGCAAMVMHLGWSCGFLRSFGSAALDRAFRPLQVRNVQ